MISWLPTRLVKTGWVVLCSKEDRVEWETNGEEEFTSFWGNLCQLPHIQEKANQGLKLLPHDGILIFRKFKALIVDLFLQDRFDVQKHLFDFTGDTDPPAASVKITKINRVRNGLFSLNALYNVSFNDGSEFEGYLAEEKVYSYFYIQEPLFRAAGNELCIALDFALGSSGCEAVVEGFYSVVKIQKHAGGQSNDVLMERSVVDWVLGVVSSLG